MTKKITSAVLCIAFLFTMSIPAFAATDLKNTAMSPQYTYINDISSTTSVSNGTAKVYARLTGVSSVTKIVISTELQQYRNGSWFSMETWTRTFSGNAATLSESSSVNSGYRYRTVSTFDVYAGSSHEAATKTSNEVSY
jgi:hypothetical protein